MSYYIYPIVILFLFIIIYGALSRRKIYKEVDRLEAWKIDIMNRPITDEISKVKGLNLSGQTEEKFENWRNEWDDIVTIQLPDIEEDLFDIDEMANKYRFFKGKELIAKANQRLEGIEAKLTLMTDEIHNLVHSEEQNRTDIIEVRQLYTELKNNFSAQRTTLGKASFAFEHCFEKVAHQFEEFEQLSNEGNYLQARELLLMMKEQLLTEAEKMEVVPQLLVQVESVIPGQLNELLSGMKEMEEDGYVLEQFKFEKSISLLKQQVDELKPLLEKAEVDELNHRIDVISNEIEQLYDTLEGEVLAKQFVQEELGSVHTQLASTHEELAELKSEAETVQLSYRITEQEMKLHKKLGMQFKELAKRFTVIEDVTVNQKHSFTSIKKLIEEFQTELSNINESTELCKNNLNTLRKDELKAKETLKALRQKVLDGKKLIQKSNIPGLPEKLITLNEEAEQNIIEVAGKLDEVPLEMTEVNSKLQEALETVEESYQLIIDTIDKSTLAEYLIQYGNRYRSQSFGLNSQLVVAEAHFRNFEYDEAIEVAVAAIEKIEPNVLEKINEIIVEKV